MEPVPASLLAGRREWRVRIETMNESPRTAAFRETGNGKRILQADFNIELGADDHALELPWVSPDGEVHYFDLRNQPELLLEITEANHNRDLAEFLSVLNQPNSIVQTAKCDTWLSNELDAEDEIFGSPWKFGSYIDMVFVDRARQTDLAEHEQFAATLKNLLAKVPDFAASADFVLRRCYYHRPEHSADHSDTGYCITFYLNGYGDDEDLARKSWTIGLKLVQNAVMQLSARKR
jgi:hypothetical protein